MCSFTNGISSAEFFDLTGSRIGREESIRIDREHPRYERAAVRPSMDQVLRTVAKTYGLKVEDLLMGRRGRGNEPRKLGMYLVKELCDLKLSEIAHRFGTSSYGTVGWACHRVAARMNSSLPILSAKHALFTRPMVVLWIA